MGTELLMGKKPASYDRRDLKFRDFLIPSRLPTPPAQFGFGTLFPDWGMLGNGPDDSVEPGFGGAGDCVFAVSLSDLLSEHRFGVVRLSSRLLDQTQDVFVRRAPGDTGMGFDPLAH